MNKVIKLDKTKLMTQLKKGNPNLKETHLKVLRTHFDLKAKQLFF